MKLLLIKIQKELFRFYAKIMDNFFKTTKFDEYLKKYSNAYKNDYKLKKDQFSFVHIPRTGGTSLHTLLTNNCNNFYNSAHNAVSINCDPKEYKYITVLRDPIERVYSYYLMQKKYEKLPFHVHATKNLSFFLQKVWNCKNGVCKFLNGYIDRDVNEDLFSISLNNLKNFYFVVDHGNFVNDVDKLRKKLNIKNKVGYLDNFKTEKKSITYEEKKIIEQYNYFDIKIYKIFKDQLYTN